MKRETTWSETPRPKSKLAAVDLDHKSVLEGDDLDDVRGRWESVSAELGSAERTDAELLPWELLGLK